MEESTGARGVHRLKPQTRNSKWYKTCKLVLENLFCDAAARFQSSVPAQVACSFTYCCRYCQHGQSVVQRSIAQSINRNSVSLLLRMLTPLWWNPKIRIGVTKEFIKELRKTRSNYHPVLKLNYFKLGICIEILLRGVAQVTSQSSWYSICMEESTGARGVHRLKLPARNS